MSFCGQKSWSTIDPPKGHLQVFTKNITNKLWTVCEYITRNIVRQKLRIKLWTVCEYVTHNIARIKNCATNFDRLKIHEAQYCARQKLRHKLWTVCKYITQKVNQVQRGHETCVGWCALVSFHQCHFTILAIIAYISFRDCLHLTLLSLPLIIKGPNNATIIQKHTAQIVGIIMAMQTS